MCTKSTKICDFDKNNNFNKQNMETKCQRSFKTENFYDIFEGLFHYYCVISDFLALKYEMGHRSKLLNNSFPELIEKK